MTTHMDLWSPELVTAPVTARKSASRGYSADVSRALEDRMLASMPGAGKSQVRMRSMGSNSASWQANIRAARNLEMSKIMHGGKRLSSKDVWEAWPGLEEPPSRQTILYALRALVADGHAASDGKPRASESELFWIVDRDED